MAKILVTGGAGFMGSNFIKYWLNKYPQDRVINLDKLTYAGHPKNLLEVQEDDRYNFIKEDILNKRAIEEIVKNIDIIVHFAAESHVDRSFLYPATFYKTNVLGTKILLDAAAKHKIKRFHHISTDEVFGELGLDDPPFSEKSPYDPRNPYSYSKAEAEVLVKRYYSAYGLPITITNSSNNFGPNQDIEKLIPKFITNLLNGEKVPLNGRGENIRSWVSVDDHSRAVDIVLTGGKIGESYCIGGQERTNLQVTQSILKLLDKNTSFIEFAKLRPIDDLRYAIDDAKIRKLGWKPQDKFQNGLKKTVTWYKDNQWWWRPIKDKSALRKATDRILEELLERQLRLTKLPYIAKIQNILTAEKKYLYGD